MNAGDIKPARADPTEPGFSDDLAFLIGCPPGTDWQPSGYRFTQDPREPYGLVLRVSEGGTDALFRSLAQAGRRLAVPFADLSGADDPRADFTANAVTAETVKSAFSATQGVRDQLRQLPEPAVKADREPLAALALALTRDGVIEARWAPDQSDLIGYPLLVGLQRPRQMLEQMAQAGLLKRRFFDRVHSCQECGSARLAAREACPKCESPQLHEEALVHHYRCGYQGSRSQFQDGRMLVCPKCAKVLRHYGVDYDAPGHVMLCGQCNEASTEPIVVFKCADCGRTTPGEDVGAVDWFHYDLTSSGRKAVTSGTLPGSDIQRLASGFSGYRTPRDLAMMIDLAYRLNRRYERPFSVVLVQMLIDEEAPSADRDKAKVLLEDLVRGIVRETDFVAAFDELLTLFLPETPGEGVQVLTGRINARVAEALGGTARIHAELVATDKVPALVDLLGKA